MVLTPRLPYPVIGGDKLRIYNICKGLTKAGNKLTLLSFVEDEQEARSARECCEKDIFEKVTVVRLSRLRSRMQALAAVAGSEPLQISYYASRKMHQAVRREFAADSYDHLLVHLIRMAQYVVDINGPTKVLEMTDALSLNYRRCQQQGCRGMLGKIYRIERSRVEKYERDCLRLFDRVVLVSDVDRNYLLSGAEQQLREKVAVVANGVSEDILKFHRPVHDSVLDPDKIVFVGNLRTQQNVDAVLFFVRDIFPIIRRERPGSRFVIVGTGPPRSIRSLHGQDGITVTGTVDTILAAIGDACVSVCPVRIGAGIQNKMLESMAAGIPVVATSMCSAGINATEGKDFLCADDPGRFAAAVLRLLQDRDLRQGIAAQARLVIRERYRWEGRLEEYLRVLNDPAPTAIAKRHGEGGLQ